MRRITTCGKAAATTALPQPPRTSQKVPMNSAAARFDSGMVTSPLRSWRRGRELSAMTVPGAIAQRRIYLAPRIASVVSQSCRNIFARRDSNDLLWTSVESASESCHRDCADGRGAWRVDEAGSLEAHERETGAEGAHRRAGGA